jgi:hypothetical protein
MTSFNRTILYKYDVCVCVFVCVRAKVTLSLSKSWYIRKVKVYFHTFFISVLDAHESTSRPGRSTPGRDPDVDWIGGWVGLEDLEKEKFLALSRIRTPDLSARSIIIIATTLSWLSYKKGHTILQGLFTSSLSLVGERVCSVLELSTGDTLLHLQDCL